MTRRFRGGAVTLHFGSREFIRRMTYLAKLEHLVTGRSAYRYVPARLVNARDMEASVVWGNLRLKMDVPDEIAWRSRTVDVSCSSRTLDQFHFDLLRGTPEEKLHGLASIVFWGFASGVDGRFRAQRALARVRFIVNGRGQSLPQPPETILRKLEEGLRHLDKNDLSAALCSLMDIDHLGMSFASKVLMFADPSRAVVYDARIAAYLRTCADENLKRLALDMRRSDPRYRRVQCPTYAEWCRHCTEIAGILEKDGYRWEDWGGQTVSDWQAVDVERAYFANTKL